MAMLFSSICSFAQDPDEGELIEIPFAQEEATVGNYYNNPANVVAKEGYSTITANGGISVFFKVKNVDVTNCDYVVFKFASETPAGLSYSFFGGTDAESFPQGVTEFKYVFSEHSNTSYSSTNVLEQVTLLKIFGDGGESVDLIGVYKHKLPSSDEPEPEPQPTYSYSTPALEGYEIVPISSASVEGFSMCPKVESENYITYTGNAGLQFAFKTLNIPVTGCDKVLVKFAETVNGNWQIAYKGTQDMESINGKDEFEIELAAGAETLPEVTILTPWGYEGSMNIKVTGIYKHISTETPEQIAAKKLAAAKETKYAAINSYVAGNALFMTTKAQKDAALAAVASAATVEAVEAVALPSVKAPEAGKAYAIKNATADGYLTIGKSGVSANITENAPVYFVAVAGGYVLYDGTNYLNQIGNGWTLEGTTDKAGAYVVNFAVQDGKYTINGSRGAIGLDDTASGSNVYADKNAGKNGLWTIEEYVAPKIEEITAVHGEVVSYSPGYTEKKDVTYVRTFASTNQWQSLCVQFTIDASKMAEQGVILAEITSIEKSGDEVVVNIKKVTEGIIPAKTPLLIAVTSSYTGSVKTGVSIIQSRTTSITEYSAATITGVLVPNKKTGIDGSYVMSGGLLRKVENAEAALPRNHWYLTLKDASAGAKVRIAGVEDDVASMDKTFDFVIKTPPAAVTVNGTTVDPSTLKSGDIYIQNGKKYIVK